MAFASLDILTNEVFELVVQYLDLHNIRALRLVSRAVAYKATQETFRSFFRHKHVDITRVDLEKFVQVTSQGRLGCLVNHLSLVGTVYNPLVLENILKTGKKYVPSPNNPAYDKVLQSCSEEELTQVQSDLDTLRQRQADLHELRGQGTDVSLLQHALANLAAHSCQGLKSLSLQVVVYRDDATTRLRPSKDKAWKWIFQAASRTFSLAMSCIRDSKLPIQAIDIFGKKPESLGCSVPCDTLSGFQWEPSAFASSFAALRMFSISIADQILVENEHNAQSCGDAAQKVEFTLYNQKRDLKPLRAQISNPAHSASLSRMLELCYNLEDLNISGYRLSRSDKGLVKLQDAARLRLMHHLAGMKPLFRLRKLRLAGLPVQIRDLGLFIEKHSNSLRDLDLNGIATTKESFAPIISQLASEKMRLLERIHLEDLFENRRIVHFQGEKNQDFTTISGDYGGRNVITCWGKDTKKVIVHQRYEGMSIGSGRVWSWNRRRSKEFGR